MLQSWHIAINVCCYLSYFSLCRQIYAVLYMCIMYAFFKNCIYFVHVNDCRLIKSKHEAAKYIYLIPIQRHFYYPLSTDQFSTKLNSVRRTYNLATLIYPS